MLLPNRHGSTDDYRYGFGGQEKDDEIKGEGNSLNYKYRMHDPRVVRFFAVDPLAKKYPYYSPYSFGGNTPIMAAELEGLEIGKPAYDYAKNWLQEKKDAGSWGAGFGLSILKNATIEGIGNEIKEAVVTLVNNPPPPKPLKETLFFPAFEFYHMGESVVDNVGKAIDGDGEAAGDILFDVGGTFIGITEAKLAMKTAKAEAQSLKSQVKQAANNITDLGGSIKYSEPLGSKIWGYIDNKRFGFFEMDGNVLKMEINLPEILKDKGIGSAFFKEAVDGVSDFRALWVKSKKLYGEKGMSDNLAEYYQNRAKKMSKEDAAWNTWTGRRAKENGFTKAEVRELDDGGIEVEFTKG